MRAGQPLTRHRGWTGGQKKTCRKQKKPAGKKNDRKKK